MCRGCRAWQLLSRLCRDCRAVELDSCCRDCRLATAKPYSPSPWDQSSEKEIRDWPIRPKEPALLRKTFRQTMVQRTRREPQRTRAPDGAKLQILNNFGWVPICFENFKIELIIMMQLACFYESYNVLVKVKWECVTHIYITDCTFAATSLGRCLRTCSLVCICASHIPIWLWQESEMIHRNMPTTS